MSTAVRYTPQKKQELRSRHQLADRLTEFGWVPVVPEDLGEDFIVHIYHEGRATGVNFFVQLKSVTNLNGRRKGDFLTYSFEVKDLLHWEQFTLPVVLIIWDVKLREGRWALVDDVIKQLDEASSSWRQQQTKTVRISWHNSTNNDDLKRLKEKIGQFLYPKLPIGLSSGNINLVKETPSGVELIYTQETGQARRLLETNVEFIFPDSQEGISNKGKFEHFIQTGERVILKNIGTKFNNIPDWYKRLFGDLLLIKGDVEISQTISSKNGPPTISASVSITDKHGYTAPLQPLDLKLISAGSETVIWSNEHQKSTPLLFTFFIGKYQAEFSLSLTDALIDLFAIRDSLKFVQTLSEGGEFRLISSENDKYASGTALPNPELRVDAKYCMLIAQLCEIQIRTGYVFRVNPFKGFDTPEDIEAIHEISSIMKTGKLVSHKQEWIESVPVEMLDNIFEAQSQSEYVSIGSYWKSSCLTLLNQEIELGHGYGFASGKVELSSKEVQELKVTLSQGKQVQLKLTDAQIIDVFPSWFLSEAKRISLLLAEKFQVSSIYLFGSLVWGDYLSPETDIDLAVNGIEPGKLYKIIGFIELETQFSFDLIDLNEALPALRERILTEGELLYERELIAVSG